MALISCPECSKSISDKAVACPHCGVPTPRQDMPQTGPNAPISPPVTVAAGGLGQDAKPKTRVGTWLVLLALIAAGFWYVNSPTYKKQFKPDMPVAVKYRRAITGPGLVLMVENRSNRHLAVFATLENPSLSHTRSFRFDIPPGGITEAGYREGWTGSSGDKIVLSHDDFKDWQGSIP